MYLVYFKKMLFLKLSLCSLAKWNPTKNFPTFSILKIPPSTNNKEDVYIGENIRVYALREKSDRSRAKTEFFSFSNSNFQNPFQGTGSNWFGTKIPPKSQKIRGSRAAIDILDCWRRRERRWGRSATVAAVCMAAAMLKLKGKKGWGRVRGNWADCWVDLVL